MLTVGLDGSLVGSGNGPVVMRGEHILSPFPVSFPLFHARGRRCMETVSLLTRCFFPKISKV